MRRRRCGLWRDGRRFRWWCSKRLRRWGDRLWRRNNWLRHDGLRRCRDGRRWRRRDVGGAPVAIGGAGAFGVIAVGFLQRGFIACGSGFACAALVGSRVKGADEKDNAAGDADHASEEQERQARRTRRQQTACSVTLDPGEIASAADKGSAKDELKTTPHHSRHPRQAAPKQPRRGKH